MQNVTENRNDYIGGSDIPIIMGLSSFKTRWQLLKEKAGIEVDEFEGNKYTEYGNVMESKIRDYINKEHGFDFKEDKLTEETMRYHVDGHHNEGESGRGIILEIKTTSRKFNPALENSLDGFQDYLVQLLTYMYGFGVASGMLAIYDRPNDFDEEFDPERLNWVIIDLDDHESLLKRIDFAVFDFKADLKKLKANPFLTENDLQPNEIQVIAQNVMSLENEISKLKELEAEYKRFKGDLYLAMTAHDVKSWELPNGAKITRVAQGEDKEVTEVDYEYIASKLDVSPELLAEATETKIKKGRAGYVKITLPKVAS